MGIRGLTTTFKKGNTGKCSNDTGIYHTTIQIIAERHYRNHPNDPLLVAVDFMEVAHHWLSRDDTQFIRNFSKFMITLLSSGVTPIFCFDGKPAPEKQSVIDARRVRRDDYTKQLDKLQQQRAAITQRQHQASDDSSSQSDDSMSPATPSVDEQLKQLDKQIARITCRTRTTKPYHCTLIKSILDMINMPYFYIPDIEGGEMICAHLQRMGHVKYCMTNDLDVFPMGASWVIREFNFRTGQCQLYNRMAIMRNLGITRPQEFIDMCILHGCDLIDRPTGLATNDIVSLIKQYGTVENIRNAVAADTTPPTSSFPVADNQDTASLDQSPLFNITFPDEYDPTIAREFFVTPILDEVRAWKPLSQHQLNSIIINKSNDHVIRDVINSLKSFYPDLGCNPDVQWAIIDMLEATVPTSLKQNTALNLYMVV